MNPKFITADRNSLAKISQKEYTMGVVIMFEVEFYTLPNGKVPVKEFIIGLDNKIKNKAIDSLLILRDKGNILREPYSKHIGNGVFELRIKFANDICRLFYFFYVDKKIIVTNGFVKKTQKTPRREIELALQYKTDYERRKRYG